MVPFVLYLLVGVLATSSSYRAVSRFRPRHASVARYASLTGFDSGESDITAKLVTKQIMAFFDGSKNTYSDRESFRRYLLEEKVQNLMDGMHVITILFQSARLRKQATDVLPIDVMTDKLAMWDKQWSERDISTFMYGLRSLTCVSKEETEFLKMAATKISLSKASLSSRAIGNALYGFQDITSDIEGVAELMEAITDKVRDFEGELAGQDIGIGLYGLQGLSADLPQVREFIGVFASKIEGSDAELDAQAMSNALYGLQSMSSEYPEVIHLVSSLATKVADSRPILNAQAIGSALYGLQKLDSDTLEVRSLLAAMVEKVESCEQGLDAKAVSTALFGLQRMKSNSAEVRALVQAISSKIVDMDAKMDSVGIGTSIYGLHSMSSDQPQVRRLLDVLANRIAISEECLNGQGIADALYGLKEMTSDCPELRKLLRALADKIEGDKGKLESQEIGNALFGLQSMTSQMEEVRTICSKLAQKLKRSTTTMRSQQIGRALLGLQSLSADSPEVRFLITEITNRIKASDRTIMAAPAIADALYGLQGLQSDVQEVQDLLTELAKKISMSPAELSPEMVGRCLFGLQGLSTQGSIFSDSAIGIDVDEVQFLEETLWDKIKTVKGKFPLSSVAEGMLGITLLKDPVAGKIRQFLYSQVQSPPSSEAATDNGGGFDDMDVITAVRALKLNRLLVPEWLANKYLDVEETHSKKPVVSQSRSDKLIVQRYKANFPAEVFTANSLVDGVRLDLDFQDMKLNIELDGPMHRYPARARYDRERDEFLTQAKGYTVARIELEGKSVDDVIKEVAEKVADAAARDVQSMYQKK
jgi:very-short-patch-repair endonuclease